MTFPAVQSRNSGSNSSSSTTQTVNLPSDITAGDLLGVLLTTRGIITSATATGWSDLGVDNNNNTSASLIFLYKTATGSEGATATFTTDASVSSAHLSFRISGWGGTPAKGTGATGVITATPDPPSVSTANGDNLFIAIAVQNGAMTVSSYPTNYSNGQISTQSGTGPVTLASAERQLSSASDNPGVFTMSAAAQWVAQTIVIGPNVGTVLTAGSGSFSETGISALFRALQVSAAGAFTETGVASAFKTSLPGGIGSYTLTGNGVTFVVGTFVTASVGSFAITGIASLMKVRTPASAGSYTLTGNASTFKPKFAAAAGAYSVSMGSAVSLHDFIASLGQYAITGEDSGGMFGLPSDTAEFFITAFDAKFNTTMELWIAQVSGSESWAAQPSGTEIWTPQTGGSETWH